MQQCKTKVQQQCVTHRCLVWVPPCATWRASPQTGVAAPYPRPTMKRVALFAHWKPLPTWSGTSCLPQHTNGRHAVHPHCVHQCDGAGERRVYSYAMYSWRQTLRWWAAFHAARCNWCLPAGYSTAVGKQLKQNELKIPLVQTCIAQNHDKTTPHPVASCIFLKQWA
jgi:hypothetical protein